MPHKTQLCISLSAETNEAMLDEMARCASEADLLEVRIDRIPSPDLPRLLRNRPKPVIVTNRPQREGGAFSGSERERLALLEKAAELGAEHVDVELDAAGEYRRRGGAKVIVSYHNFDETPRSLGTIYRRLVEAGADVPKIAVAADDIRDNLRVFDLLDRVRDSAEARRRRKAAPLPPLPTIALCMGELGAISRILAPKFGAYLTFASAGEGQATAPGQLTAAQLRGLYRFGAIGHVTAVCGLIADPVAHSLSPHIHNAAFDAAGLDAVYVPFRVQGDPAEFVSDFAPLNILGYSVTIPHKETVLAAMDEVEPLVRRLGAMNTVVARDGRFFGFNTDCSGALGALERALGGSDPLQGKHVAILGAGGAARALAYGAADRGASVTVCNRTVERGERLALEVGGRAVPLEKFADLSPRPDILVNATRVGMWPDMDETPVPPDAISPETFVYDSVYNPVETKLLREARARGCPTLTGVDWFIGQGAAQFELWFGREAPREAMRRAMLSALGA